MFVSTHSYESDSEKYSFRFIIMKMFPEQGNHFIKKHTLEETAEPCLSSVKKLQGLECSSVEVNKLSIHDEENQTCSVYFGQCTCKKYERNFRQAS